MSFHISTMQGRVSDYRPACVKDYVEQLSEDSSRLRAAFSDISRNLRHRSDAERDVGASHWTSPHSSIRRALHLFQMHLLGL